MIIVTVRLSDVVILVLFAFAERKIYNYTYAYDLSTLEVTFHLNFLPQSMKQFIFLWLALSGHLHNCRFSRNPV